LAAVPAGDFSAFLRAPADVDTCAGTNWLMRRSAPESSINRSSRRSRVASRFALTTHQIAAFRYEGGCAEKWRNASLSFRRRSA
jgi:hypothetical protein